MGLFSNRKSKIIDEYIKSLSDSSKSINKSEVIWKVIIETNNDHSSFDSEYHFRTKKEAVDFAYLKKNDNSKIELWKLDTIM